MRMKSVVLVSFVAALFLVLTGCVKQPTRSEQVTDDRPAISFKLQSGQHPDGSYKVYVDNLSMGGANQFVAGKSALRLLSGSHLVRVVKDGEKVYEETLYLGDGAIREILLP